MLVLLAFIIRIPRRWFAVSSRVKMKFGWSLLSFHYSNPSQAPEIHFTTHLYYCVHDRPAGMAGFSGYVITCTGVHLKRI